jgi:hypothetical protein
MIGRMASVNHWWSPTAIYQANGSHQWDWAQGGEEEHYWAYSVRPTQANMLVEVERQWATIDQNSLHVEHFVVRVDGYDRGSNGGLLRFNVIKVEGS